MIPLKVEKKQSCCHVILSEGEKYRMAVERAFVHSESPKRCDSRRNEAQGSRSV